MEAVGPSREQLDRLMAVMKTKENIPVKKRVLRTALVAVALCAALVATALAASPTLREALAQALGLFAPYSREVEGVSVTDQGIQVRVVSALSDGNAARVYFEVQDLEGDRLSAFTHMDASLEPPENAAWHSVGWGGMGTYSYDAQTRTALMCFAMDGAGEPAKDLTLQLELSNLIPSLRWWAFPFPEDVAITREALPSETLGDGKVVLKPGQTVRELEPGFVSLSSCGFAEDGLLHFQYELAGEEWNQEESFLDVYFSSEAGRTGAYYNDRPKSIYFQRGGVAYCEEIYNVTPDDLDDLTFQEIQGWCATGESVDGHWKLEIPLEDAPSREIDMADTTTILGIEAKTLYLTQFGATMKSDPHGEAGTMGYDLTVFGPDDTVVARAGRDDVFHTGRYATDHWTFPQPVDPEDVTAVALGLWYVPIENGVAQSGHWLDKQP